MQDYHELEIWQRGMALAVRIYEFTADLPGDERYNLTSQLRRAAVSVPLNIAEGAACASPAEFAQFPGYAYRSLKELVTGLELCERLYTRTQVHSLIDEGNQISRMVRALIGKITPEARRK